LEIKAHLDFIRELHDDVLGLETSYGDPRVPMVASDVDSSARRAAESSTQALAAVKDALTTASVNIDKAKSAADAEYATWEAQFAPVKAEYENVVKEPGGNQGALDQRRRKLLAELATVEKEIAAATTKAQGLRSITESRNEILNTLDVAYREYFDERTNKCAFFTRQSNGSINVSIAEGRDVSQFKQKLLGIKRGSYIKEDDLDQLVQTITPRDLVSAALAYEHKAR
jgi:hypothetical protein